MLTSLLLSLSMLEAVEVDTVTTLGDLPAPLVDWTISSVPPRPCKLRIIVDKSCIPWKVIQQECVSITCAAPHDCDKANPQLLPDGTKLWGCRCE